MSRRQWTGLVFWFAAVSSVTGQSSNVTTCIPSFQWSLNSLQQTPCYVAAYLESACGTPMSVDSIPVGTHYLGPTLAEANLCLCNSVTYSMISACGGCQGRTFTTYTNWTVECATTLTTFPQHIPNNVVVPLWAYLNISQTNNNFSVSAAEAIGNSPIPTSSSTSSSTILTSTRVSTATSSASSSTPTSAGKSRSNAGAIAGGVVGGLVLLAVIGLSVLWFILRKRRNAIQKDLSFDSRALVSGQQSMATRSTNGPPAFSSQSIYTSDMSTFPGSPLTTSGVFTTIPPSRRSLESVSPSVAQLGGGPQLRPAQHGYTGMPEI